MSVGHSPNEPSWKFDMRKDDKEVTEAEKQDAKRRIQGAVGANAEESPEDSGVDDASPLSPGDGFLRNLYTSTYASAGMASHRREGKGPSGAA